MATRRRRSSAEVAPVVQEETPAVEITEDVYLSKYDKISEEKFAELEARIAKLEEFVRNKLIKINSARLYNEMTTFIWNNGRAEAQRSYNDDLVMATAISCWVRDTALVVNQRELDYRKAMLSSISTSKTKFDTRIAGMTGYKAKQDSFSPGKHKETQAYAQMNYIALLKG